MRLLFFSLLFEARGGWKFGFPPKGGGGVEGIAEEGGAGVEFAW